MHQQLPTHPPPPRRRWKWTRRVAIAVLLLVVVASGTIGLLFFLAQREWREAVAEADRLDPGWRLEELEAKRAQIADADNAALCTLAAYKLLPKGWPD
jgi:hypothetical protein